MKASFNADGSIHITIDTLEEKIILENLYKLHNNGCTITFVRDGQRLIASPQTIIPPVFNQHDLASKHGVVFTPEHVAAILQYLNDGAKLAAVKYVKEVTGIGLKEAKDLVDEFPIIRKQADLNSNNVRNTIFTHIFTPKQVMVIVGYLPNERLLAIKYIQEALGIGLEEAKKAFEYFMAINAHIL